MHTLVSTAIQRELGLESQLESVQVELLPLGVVVRGVTVTDPVYGRFAEAQLVRVRPSFRALMRGGLDLNEIDVRGARVHLILRDGQILNLPQVEGGGGGEFELPFDELRAEDVHVELHAEPIGHGDIHVERADLRDLGHDELDSFVRIGRSTFDHERGTEVLESLEAHAVIDLAEEELRVPHLLLRSEPLRVAVERGRIPMSFGEHGYRGHVEVDLDVGHLPELPLPITLPRLNGQLELRADLTSEGEEQEASGRVRLVDGRVNEFWIGDWVDLRVAANRREVRILEGSRVQNRRAGGQVDLTARMGIEDTLPLEADLQLNGLSFGDLMAGLDVSQNSLVEWIFDGSIHLEGQLNGPNGPSIRGPIRLNTHDFMLAYNGYQGQPIRRAISITRGRFTGQMVIRPDAVRFEQLSGTLPRSHLRADVHLGFNNQFRVDGAIDHVDLRDVTPLDRWPMLGVGRATCNITGTFQAPVVGGEVDLEGFLFDTFRLGHVRSAWRLDPDGMGVHFPMVHAEKNESRYRVEELYLDFHQDRFALNGQLHLDRMRILDFYHVFGYEEDERFVPYQGLARGLATLRYTNGFPGDSPSGTLDVQADLELDRADLDGYAFTDGRFLGSFRWLDWSQGYRGARLEIHHLSLRKGAGTVNLQGSMELGGRLRMTAVADNLAIEELEGISDRLPGLTGTASALANVGGTAELMRIEMDTSLTNLTYEGAAIGDARAYVRHTDRDDPWVQEAARWRADAIPEGEPCAHARRGLARAGWPADPPLRTVDGLEERLSTPMAFLICGGGLGGRLALDLAVGRTQQRPLRGRIALSNLDLSPFLPRLEAGSPQIEAGLTGELIFRRGGMMEPETLGGTVALSEVYARVDDRVEVRNHQPVRLLFKDGFLQVQRARFVSGDSRLTLRGHASFDEGLAFQVAGDLDLGLVADLTDAVAESDGRLRLRVALSGPFAQPEYLGSAVLRGGTLRPASLDERLTDVEARINFSQRRIVLESFGARLASGRIYGSGEASLVGLGTLDSYEVRINAEDIAVEPREGFELAFDARTRLAFHSGERLPTLRGEVRVGRLLYSRPIELEGRLALGQLLSRSSRAEVERYDPEDDLVRLDLRVQQDAPFRITNNLADVEMRIEEGERPFRIVGTNQRYGVLGTMTLPRGVVHFRNNDFDVRRGMITFEDGARLDPRFDVMAVTEVRRASDLSAPSWRIRLHAHGTVDSFQLDTSSEPEVSQEDVLMLLAVGMTRAEFEAGGIGGMTGTAIEALTTMAGVDREVRRVLPDIDEFRITSWYSPRTGRTEPGISVGARLADRVRLTGATSISEAQEFRTAVEWRLNTETSVQASYDNYNFNGASSLGNLGVDLRWRLEFE